MIDIDKTDNQAVQPGQLDEDNDKHLSMLDDLREGRKHAANWRTMARESYGFYAGPDQWSQEDRAKLQEQQRPAVVFNRTARTVNAVSGLERQNRQEIRTLPREVNDSAFSEYETQVIRSIRDNADAEDEESEGFVDTLISGLGWIEIRPDFEYHSDGRVKICFDQFDPMEALWDPMAKKINLIDARWVAHIQDMDKKKFKEMFPDKTFVSGSFWKSDVDGEQPHDATNAFLYENDQSDKQLKNKTTWVAQYQCWEKEPWYKVLSPEGRIVDFPEDRFKVMKKQLDEMGVKYTKYQKKVYKEYFLNGKEILEEKTLPCYDFTLQPITGFKDRNNSYWFGIVELMKDPQRWANKWLSQIQHILNTQAKSGWWVEEGVLSDPQKAKNEAAQPGSITFLKPGGMDRIKEKEMPRYPEGLDRLLQYAITSINDVPGVNLELIGLANRDQAIGLEESRKKAGITILATLFNSLRLYRKRVGRILGCFIREYMQEGELIRTVGQEGAQYVPLMKDKLAFEFDTIVEEAPSSPNMKERVYPYLAQAVDMALRANIPVPPDILDFSPLPDGLIQKWKSMINKSQNNPEIQQMNQIKTMLAQLEVKLKQAEVDKTKSEAIENMAQAGQAQATGQDESAQAMQKMGMAKAEHQMSIEEMRINQRIKELEAEHSARLKEIEVAHSLRLKKAESDAKIQMQKEQSTAKAAMMKQTAKKPKTGEK